MENIQRIGQIGNYYGGRYISTKDGKFFWGSENWTGIKEIEWEEITQFLYKTILSQGEVNKNKD